MLFRVLCSSAPPLQKGCSRSTACLHCLDPNLSSTGGEKHCGWITGPVSQHWCPHCKWAEKCCCRTTLRLGIQIQAALSCIPPLPSLLPDTMEQNQDWHTSCRALVPIQLPFLGWVCAQDVCPGRRWRHTLLKTKYDQQAAPGTITSHSWMRFCFQTRLLQPATRILQAILMFLESPRKNNHIIQISQTCGPLNSCQNQIHAPLRGARGIAETKRHHIKLGEWDVLSLDKLLGESAVGSGHRAHLEGSTTPWCGWVPWAAPLPACFSFRFCPHFWYSSAWRNAGCSSPVSLEEHTACWDHPAEGLGAEEPFSCWVWFTRAHLVLILLTQCQKQWDLNPCFGS